MSFALGGVLCAVAGRLHRGFLDPYAIEFPESSGAEGLKPLFTKKKSARQFESH